MVGFHFISLIVVLVIGLVIAGPKALQSLSRNVGKSVGQAKVMKEKVMSELPMEEISGLSQSISKIPLNPQQAMQRLLTLEQETKEESSSGVQKD